MWSTSNSSSFKLPTKDEIANLYEDGIIPKFRGLIYLSLDFGLIWNPNGKKYPTDDPYGVGWVWCSPDCNYMIDYITLLWKSKIIPVLYASNITISLAAKILKEFKIHPPIFLNINLDTLNRSITSQWLNNSEMIIGTLPIGNCGLKLEPDFITYRLGPDSSIGNNVKLEDIGLDPIRFFHDIKTPTMILLMGQYGCGKTIISKRLTEKGWYVIDEREAAAIRIGSTRKNSNIVNKFINTLQSLKTSLYKGIIIDCSNYLKKDRMIFESLANKQEIPYCIKWITRPGHFYNDKRQIKVIDTMLNIYSEKLEIPEEEKCERLV